MSDPRPIPDPADESLRDALERGDAILASTPAVLAHLLRHDDDALFAEDVLSRLRGMAADLAGQLALAVSGSTSAERGFDLACAAEIEDALIAMPGLLAHLHAVAIEWQVTEALQGRLGLDPVLSPLVQALVASPDGETGAAAMKMLAAQARFVQHQRQMRLPLGELPPGLLNDVLGALAGFDPSGRGLAAIRARYDEGSTRLGLLARLVSSMGAGAIAALSLAHGGLALFATTMAMACDLSREACILATREGQMARLALSLRAAGLRPHVIEENLLAFHPGALAPLGVERFTPEAAAALLAQSPLALATGG